MSPSNSRRPRQPSPPRRQSGRSPLSASRERVPGHARGRVRAPPPAAIILDGGPCRVGIELTVLDLTGPTPVLLRPGGITLEDLTHAAVRSRPPRPVTPRRGLRAACRAIMRPLCRYGSMQCSARPGEALLAFGPEAPPGFAQVVFLSHRGDLAEAAANLFAMLRRLDRPEFSGIAVMPIPERGLGRAINDRLRRAAAPRSAIEPAFAPRRGGALRVLGPLTRQLRQLGGASRERPAAGG